MTNIFVVGAVTTHFPKLHLPNTIRSQRNGKRRRDFQRRSVFGFFFCHWDTTGSGSRFDLRVDNAVGVGWGFSWYF